MNKYIEGRLTIGRSSNDVVRIQFKDCNSVTRFATAELSLEQYAQAITGLSEVHCIIEISNLQNVGLRRISDTFEFELEAQNSYGRNMHIEQLLRDVPDGWKTTDELSSQNSFFEKDGKRWARATIHKWVKEEDLCRNLDQK